MKNINTNIENIFEKAKNMEPILDDNEVRELIASKSAPIAYNKLINNGVKKMTITASVTSAIIAGLILINSINYESNKNENIITSGDSKNVEKIIHQSEQLPGNIEKDLHKSNIEPDYIATNTIQTDNNVDLPKSNTKITGVNTIVLPYNDLERYNITYDENTKTFEVFSGNMKLRINPNMHTEFKKINDETLQNNKLSPKLITSSNGNVKIAFLSNKVNRNNSSNETPNRVLYTEKIDHRSFDAKDFDDLSFPEEQINLHTLDSLISYWGSSDNFGRFRIDMDNLSSSLSFFNNTFQLDLSQSDDGNVKYEYKVEINRPDSFNVQQSFDIQADAEDYTSFENKTMNIDSIINLSTKIIINRNSFNLDSLIHEKIHNINSMNIDSIIQYYTLNFIKLEDKNKILEEHQKEILMNKNEKLKLMNIRIDMLNDMTVNKLIPIQFDIPNNKSNVIFWFEPTEELLEIVPEELKERIQKELNALKSNKDICDAEPVTGSETIMDVWRSCSGAIENMMVFPNPTNGPVSVSFKLKEERRVSISLHDLTGKLIAQIAPETTINSGEYKENFNLKNISPGMYLLVAQTHYGEQTLQRIIIE
jgi:hypothetical protein